MLMLNVAPINHFEQNLKSSKSCSGSSMMRSVVVALALFAQPGQAAFCSSSPDEGDRVSAYPILDEATASGTFLRSVENAAVYESGPDNARFNIVHVWGNPYEQGYAQGVIMKDDLHK
jgi:hypothetical protein